MRVWVLDSWTSCVTQLWSDILVNLHRCCRAISAQKSLPEKSRLEHYFKSDLVNYFPITSFMSFLSHCTCRTLSGALIPAVSRGNRRCGALVALLDSWRELYVNHLTYYLPSHLHNAEHISAIQMQRAKDVSPSRLEHVRRLFLSWVECLLVWTI